MEGPNEPKQSDGEILPWLIVGGALLVIVALALSPLLSGSQMIGGWGFFGLFGAAWAIGLAALILCIVIAIEAKNQGRSGWWIYLICAFVSPLSYVAVIAWYAHLRKNPLELSSTVSM